MSIKPALEGKSIPARDLFWHYPHYANQGSRPGGAIRRGDYKLIEYYEPYTRTEPRRRELYRLSQDRSESQNLAPKEPQLVAELAQALEVWRQRVGAVLPSINPDYRPNPPNAQGILVLPGRTARVFGRQLRFEPLPHKNTLGYWTEATDSVQFDCSVPQPRRYEVELTYGCGTGSGGSEVRVVGPMGELRFIVEATGGFQKYVPHIIGTLDLPAGVQSLNVEVIRKPGLAVMDLQQIRLLPKELSKE